MPSVHHRGWREEELSVEALGLGARLGLKPQLPGCLREPRDHSCGFQVLTDGESQGREGVQGGESNRQPQKAKEPRVDRRALLEETQDRSLCGTYLLPPEHQSPAQPASPRTPTEESTSFFPRSLTLEAMMCQTAWIQAQPLAV